MAHNLEAFQEGLIIARDRARQEMQDLSARASDPFARGHAAGQETGLEMALAFLHVWTDGEYGQTWEEQLGGAE